MGYLVHWLELVPRLLTLMILSGARSQASGRLKNVAATKRWQQLQEAGAD